ncbi:unnamed protein product [Linum trigynum]|uniref:Uncharacterized protein n=1 Tax=Linum trigynum TaxID=586398 RepID=A0AAV2FC44_9ROSI
MATGAGAPDFDLPDENHSKYVERIGAGASVYLSAVLECLAPEVLELTGNATRDNKKNMGYGLGCCQIGRYPN